MARLLIVGGVVLILAGLAWPWLSRLGLGRLPGDILIQRGQTSFYFPIVTCIIVSVVLSVLFWLFRK
jgi:hypothetical protein